MEATNLGYRHVVLRRDIPALPRYVERGLLTWGEIRQSYRGKLAYFDFDRRDWKPTAATLKGCARVAAGTVLRSMGLMRRLGD
jgi:hypothetical protein